MHDILKSVRSILGGLFLIFALVFFGVMIGLFHQQQQKLMKPSILVLDLEGIILDGKQFLEDLREYRGESNIKGVLVRINSPGGAVGPSQEIFSELKRVRDELKKPVVVSTGSLAASGGYYAAVAADRIVTNPGSLMGSIGVIMEFANLERLYSWAKIERYSLKTGAYKDAGADYRAMTADEKKLFQELIDSVHAQFKDTVAKSRKLDREVVDKYADGRVFTGEAAVKLGFADVVGTYQDAIKIIGELAGLGVRPELFEPPEKRPSFMELVSEMSESTQLRRLTEQFLPQQLLARPLYLMPGAMGL